ncbi:MAG: hypothetical protein KIT57_20280 [Blastocatellales bacterium]|nr:hypothetical protein [Blastocatellales bacterium]
MPLGYFPAADENGEIRFWEVELDENNNPKLGPDGEPIIRPAKHPEVAAFILIKQFTDGSLSDVTIDPSGASTTLQVGDPTTREGFVGEYVVGTIFEVITDRKDLTPDQQWELLRRIYGDDPRVIGLVITYVSDSAARKIWGDSFEIGPETLISPEMPAPLPPQGMGNVKSSQGDGALPPAGGAGGVQPGGASLNGSPTGQPGGDSDGQGTGSEPGKTGGDPVVLASGQLYHQVTDLEVAGLGLHFAFTRTYLNQTIYKGPLGYHWDHAYNLWLRESREFLPDGSLQNVVYRSTGSVREDRYTQVIGSATGEMPPLGGTTDAVFEGPPGFFDRLEKTGGCYILETPAGVRFEYGENLYAERITDRNGNTMTLRYDGYLLVEIIDAVGRRFTLEYDSLNRITALRDHTGNRSVRYFYSSNGDLEEVDHLLGDMVSGVDYRYSGAELPFELQHNLTHIISPKGECVLECIYGETPGALEYNRVVRQRAADGEFAYEYDFVHESGVDPSLDPINVPRTLTRVAHPNGHILEHWFNAQGNAVRRTERILGSTGLVETLTASFRYNADGLLIEERRPEGSALLYRYEREAWGELHGGSAEGASAAERLSFGNLLRIVEMPRPGFNETRRIVTEYTYTRNNRLASQRGPYYSDLQLRPLSGQTIGEVFHDYDERGNLTAVRYADTIDARGEAQRVEPTHYIHDERGRLAEIITGGLRTQLAYFDGDVRSGHVRERIADADGARLATSFEVDALGRLTGVQDPFGARTDIEYTPFDAVKRVVLPEMRSGGARPEIAYLYDKNRQVIRTEETILSPDGSPHPDGSLVQSFRYDQYGRRVRMSAGTASEPELRVLRTIYHPAGVPQREIDALGNQTLIRHDARMFAGSVTMAWGKPEQVTRRLVYNRAGETIEVIDGRGARTRIERDAFGRARRVLTPDGNAVECEYDASGRVVRKRLYGKHPETGAVVRWSETEMRYDALGRMIEAIDHVFSPGETAEDELQRTRFLYDGLHRLERVIDAEGVEWLQTHDRLGRLVARRDAQGNETRFEYDDAARTLAVIGVESGINEAGERITQVFSSTVRSDARGLPVEEIDDLARTTLREYDSRGLLVRITAPAGRVFEIEYDVFGQPVRQQITAQDRARRKQVEYDANGNVIGLELSSGNRVEYVYDGLNRLVRTLRDGITESEYEYDAEGNATTERNENGVVFKREYSAEGRMLREEADLNGFKVSGDDPSYRPAEASRREFSYTPPGAIAVARNDLGECRYRFDSLGRLLEERCNDLRFMHRYDAVGRRTNLIYPDGRQLAFAYVPAGGLAEILQTSRGANYPGDAAAPDVRRLLSITRIGGRPLSMRFGEAINARIHYDPLQRVVGMDWTQATAGASALASVRNVYGVRGELRIQQADDRFRILEYDALTHLSTVREYTGEPLIDCSGIAAAQGFSSPGPVDYQARMSALISEAEARVASRPVARRFDYRLDERANRLATEEATEPGGQLSIVNYETDVQDRYIEVGGRRCLYDCAGNLLGDGVNRYRYDAYNRLAEAETPEGRVEMRRDALGRLVEWRTPETERRLLYAGLRVLEIRRGSEIEAQVIPLERPNQFAHLAAGGADRFPVFDAMDSLLGWAAPNGEIKERSVYDPFGRVLEQSAAWPGPFGFSGYLADACSGVYETYARSYHPGFGRFLQRDPLGFADGANVYAYAHHAPGTLTDYFGFSSNEIDWWTVGWSAGSTLLTGAALMVGATALVVTGIVSLPALVFAGGVGLTFSVAASILGRASQSIQAGKSEDINWAILYGIGDQFGITDIYQGATGNNIWTGETLGTKRRSELLGGGIGAGGSWLTGTLGGRPIFNSLSARMPSTRWSGPAKGYVTSKYWMDKATEPAMSVDNFNNPKIGDTILMGPYQGGTVNYRLPDGSVMKVDLPESGMAQLHKDFGAIFGARTLGNGEAVVSNAARTAARNGDYSLLMQQELPFIQKAKHIYFLTLKDIPTRRKITWLEMEYILGSPKLRDKTTFIPLDEIGWYGSETSTIPPDSIIFKK